MPHGQDLALSWQLNLVLPILPAAAALDPPASVVVAVVVAAVVAHGHDDLAGSDAHTASQGKSCRHG